MNTEGTCLEAKRLTIQSLVDATKTQAERNRLGQFATPTSLSLDMLNYAAECLSEHEEIRFLDPAIGTGSFYSAITNVFPKTRVSEAVGFDVDPAYAKPAIQLWSESGLKVHISDFTIADPSPRFNLVICNPPYVRHHHLRHDEKLRLQQRTHAASGMKLGGLAGLYCHFMGLTHPWMYEGGLAGWLIPSEFMDVNYGQALRQYLLSQVTLLHIHRFEPDEMQFADALVSSAVVWFRKSKPPLNHEVQFSFGGSLLNPRLSKRVRRKDLELESKWTRFPSSPVRGQSPGPTISDLFDIRRGIATGDNGFFILREKDILERGLPKECFTPILPSPRHLPQDEVGARHDGTPDIEIRQFVLNTRLSESDIAVRYPALKQYLDEGRERGREKGYLCSHRTPWYSQEHRLPPPIVCTYIGRSDCKRGKPFRFILNESTAIVANVYLAMYPKPVLARAVSKRPELLRLIWTLLNELSTETLIGEGRVYGGGLYKLEPKELANVAIPGIAAVLPSYKPSQSQTSLLPDLVAYP